MNVREEKRIFKCSVRIWISKLNSLIRDKISFVGALGQSHASGAWRQILFVGALSLSPISPRPVAHWDIDSWQVRVTVADNHETTDSTDDRFQNLFVKDNWLGHRRTMLLPSWLPLMIQNWTCTGVSNWQFDISYNKLVRGEWDLFLGPLEWARAEVGGSTKECWSGGNSQGLLCYFVTRCPPSVFHNNSTLNFKLSWVSCKFIETVRVSLKLRVEFL